MINLNVKIILTGGGQRLALLMCIRACRFFLSLGLYYLMGQQLIIWRVDQRSPRKIKLVQMVSMKNINWVAMKLSCKLSNSKFFSHTPLYMCCIHVPLFLTELSVHYLSPPLSNKCQALKIKLSC